MENIVKVILNSSALILFNHLAMVGLLLTIIWKAHTYYNNKGEEMAIKWLANDIVMESMVAKDNPNGMQANDILIKRMNNQIEEIKGRIIHHFLLMAILIYFFMSKESIDASSVNIIIAHT